IIMCYLLTLNVVAFIVYGIDKYKARKGKWRISEATLLLMAVIGGSIGAWIGMKAWHHKTLHKKFRFGIPAILVAQISLLLLMSCSMKRELQAASFAGHDRAVEHSPSVFLLMYDKEIGKGPLLEAVGTYRAEIVCDYDIIPGMAIRKPADSTLEEAMEYFRKVKGVVSVEYNHIYRLTDPVKPGMELHQIKGKE
ncbi:MAG: DUF1294 domain-containing protein, partial [Prevotella sp.]|nr:DUF1294 domain-containing protein [Prevotella sp.]